MPVTLTADRVTPQGLRKNLPGLWSLGLASCLAVTTEMLPVGLLPDIGHTFAVSDSVTGLLVSLYAVMVATLAVPLTLATSRFARKPLLLATLLGYALSNALVAAAPYSASSRPDGQSAASPTPCSSPSSSATSRDWSHRADVGRALALVGGGASAGFVVGVPLSTTLGTAVGWRSSFAVLAVMAVLTFALVSRLLPGVAHEPTAHRPDRRGRRQLTAVSMSNMLTFLGQFTVYTFISVVLLASGSHRCSSARSCSYAAPAAFSGYGTSVEISTRTRDEPRCSSWRRSSARWSYSVGRDRLLVAVMLAAAVWNAAFGGVPSIYQACAVRTHAVSPEMAGAWTNATANVGIAGGAAIGAGLFPDHGYSGRCRGPVRVWPPSA